MQHRWYQYFLFVTRAVTLIGYKLWRPSRPSSLVSESTWSTHLSQQQNRKIVMMSDSPSRSVCLCSVSSLARHSEQIGRTDRQRAIYRYCRYNGLRLACRWDTRGGSQCGLGRTFAVGVTDLTSARVTTSNRSRSRTIEVLSYCKLLYASFFYWSVGAESEYNLNDDILQLGDPYT